MSIEQSLFQGELVCLTPFDYERDPEIEAGWTNDAEFLRLTSPSPARPQTISQVRNRYEEIEKNIQQEKSRFYFAVRLRAGGRLIGYADIYWVDWVHGCALMKIAIGKPEDRGKGYGRETLAMLLRYVFHELNLYRISAIVPEYALPARRLFEKAGFTLEVNQRQGIQYKGKTWGWLWYGMLRSEWEKKTAPAPVTPPEATEVGETPKVSLPADLFRGNLVRLAREEAKTFAEGVARFGSDTEYVRLCDAGAVFITSQKKTEEWMEKNLKEENMEGFIFSIRTLEGDKMIGDVGLYGFQWQNRWAWLGIGIGAREYWGQGYGADAMRLIVRYGLRELNLHRISLNTFEYNPRAVRCYEKVGFRHEGRVRAYLNREGRRWDILYMGILEDEFVYDEA